MNVLCFYHPPCCKLVIHSSVTSCQSKCGHGPHWLVLFISSFVCPAVLHFLKDFITASTEIQNLPEFVLTSEVDEILVGYYDNKKIDVKPDWGKEIFRKDPEQLELLEQQCFHVLPNTFRALINTLMSLFNQSGGKVCNILGFWYSETSAPQVDIWEGHR